MRPVFVINFWRAASSSAMFLLSNGIPFCERNSFAVWQDCQLVE
jgi:hypothetical protein